MRKISKQRKKSIAEFETTRGIHVPRNDDGCIGAHSDYRREDYVFQRQQSLAMRGMDWDARMPRIRHWGSNIVANLMWEVFA